MAPDASVYDPRLKKQQPHVCAKGKTSTTRSAPGVLKLPSCAANAVSKSLSMFNQHDSEALHSCSTVECGCFATKGVEPPLCLIRCISINESGERPLGKKQLVLIFGDE